MILTLKSLDSVSTIIFNRLKRFYTQNICIISLILDANDCLTKITNEMYFFKTLNAIKMILAPKSFDVTNATLWCSLNRQYTQYKCILSLITDSSDCLKKITNDMSCYKNQNVSIWYSCIHLTCPSIEQGENPGKFDYVTISKLMAYLLKETQRSKGNNF